MIIFSYIADQTTHTLNNETRSQPIAIRRDTRIQKQTSTQEYTVSEGFAIGSLKLAEEDNFVFLTLLEGS